MIDKQHIGEGREPERAVIKMKKLYKGWSEYCAFSMTAMLTLEVISMREKWYMRKARQIYLLSTFPQQHNSSASQDKKGIMSKCQSNIRQYKDHID